MAYEIEVAEGNIDTPLTNFPTSVDNFPRMSDVSLTTLPLVIQYNTYYQAGNIAAANQLVETNPELAYCIYTANGHNQIRDAIIAMQYYLLNQIDSTFEQMVSDAKDAFNINDAPTEEQASEVAYSAEKVNQLIEDLRVLLLETYSNVDNTADKDKSVKYAATAGSADTAISATTAQTANTLDGLTVGVTQLNYTDGLTGNIQSQINSKQPTLTGAVTTIADSNLTANRALISNGSGKVAVSAVTSTELGYLDGVTSAIQTQLNGKAASSHNQAAGTITAGTLAGKVLANATAVATVTDKQVRNIFADTTDVGSVSMNNGDIYLQYV